MQAELQAWEYVALSSAEIGKPRCPRRLSHAQESCLHVFPGEDGLLSLAWAMFPCCGQGFLVSAFQTEAALRQREGTAHPGPCGRWGMSFGAECAGRGYRAKVLRYQHRLLAGLLSGPHRCLAGKVDMLRWAVPSPVQVRVCVCVSRLSWGSGDCVFREKLAES